VRPITGNAKNVETGPAIGHEKGDPISVQVKPIEAVPSIRHKQPHPTVLKIENELNALIRV
jgi:hypothetical protein